MLTSVNPHSIAHASHQIQHCLPTPTISLHTSSLPLPPQQRSNSKRAHVLVRHSTSRHVTTRQQRTLEVGEREEVVLGQSELRDDGVEELAAERARLAHDIQLLAAQQLHRHVTRVLRMRALRGVCVCKTRMRA